jgi:hypothetical protein
MKEEKTTPIRQRMIEDMHIRGLAEKTQKAHIRNVKLFAASLGRPPDTATPDDLREWQLHMVKAGVSASTFNVRIISLRFFFGITSGCEEMKRYMQIHRQEAAGGPQRRGGREAPRLGSGSGAEVPRGARHQLWGGTSGLRGLHPQGEGYRQPAHADPCRSGQGLEGPAGHAVARPPRGAAPILTGVAARGLAVPQQAEDLAAVAAAAEPGVHVGQAHSAPRRLGSAAMAVTVSAEARNSRP